MRWGTSLVLGEAYFSESWWWVKRAVCRVSVHYFGRSGIATAGSMVEYVQGTVVSKSVVEALGVVLDAIVYASVEA